MIVSDENEKNINVFMMLGLNMKNVNVNINTVLQQSIGSLDQKTIEKRDIIKESPTDLFI